MLQGERNIGFWDWATRDPERVALINPDGEWTTYRELLASSRCVAHGLIEQGLKAGDSVATVLPNCVELYEVLMASLEIGLYFTPINHYLVANEIAYVLSDSEAKALFAHGDYSETVRDVLTRSGFASDRTFGIGGFDGMPSYTDFKKASSSSPPAHRTAGLVMVYTSGTTGRPKGVREPFVEQSPEESAIVRAAFGSLIGWRPGEDHYLLNGPLHHSAPLAFSSMALHMGHTVVMTDKWDAEAALKLIDAHKITNTQMVPIHFHRLLKLPESVRSRYDVSSVKSILHSAAPCPVSVKRAMIDWFGPVIHEFYGGTEGGVSYCDSEEWLAKPGTVGKPWPTVDVRILNEAREALPNGEIGVVYFRSSKEPPEYFNDPIKTEASRHGEFFTLSDVGYLDKDSWLFLVERRTDMLISGGVNIYPAEIEAVLLEHPKVRDAAVIGIDNQEWGQEVKAILEAVHAEDTGDALANEVIAFCRGKLAGFKIPRSIDFVEELPRAPNGKLYKRQLRETYQSQRRE